LVEATAIEEDALEVRSRPAAPEGACCSVLVTVACDVEGGFEVDAGTTVVV
tara:strand:+ start:15142 stop:15294 length:153 start_codon:yes stop_codon:yes gene_type:complete